jgi:hypothetical protein
MSTAELRDEMTQGEVTGQVDRPALGSLHNVYERAA